MIFDLVCRAGEASSTSNESGGTYNMNHWLARVPAAHPSASISTGVCSRLLLLITGTFLKGSKMKFSNALKRIGGFLVRIVKKHPKPILITVAVIVLWNLVMPTHILRGGANMGKLRYSEELNTITVDGHLYPRMIFFAAWSQASNHKPAFNTKADKMVVEWLKKHPGFELGSVNSSDGDRETSFLRNTARKNRRLQVTREYTLKKRSSGSSESR